MNARDEILRRIREATRDVADKEPERDVQVTWTYGRPLPTPDIVADLTEKIEDYKASVTRVPEAEVGQAVVEALKNLGGASAVAPDGLPTEWVEALKGAGIEVLSDEPQLSHQQLNNVDGVVTTCAVAMADSGTIALDHTEGQGRRALTLLPDRHVCVVRVDQIVSDVPEGIARLAPALRERRPVTWLSGGSATSDIELSRVEGVHGPRHLAVIIAG